jgi:histidinol-phosphate aminotransferase
MTITELARPEIRELEAYRPTMPDEAVLLNNNESPWPPPDISNEFMPAMNRYPFIPRELRQRMAAYYGVSDEQLLLTRGSDDGIDALLRTFCRAGIDNIIVSSPTFGMYAISAHIQGARVTDIPLTDEFDYRLPEVIRAVDDSTRLVFICSPNNPSGNAIPLDTIRAACDALRDRAIVVVDEAYGDFLSQPAAVSLLDDFDNLVVLRTVSKGLALAGARIGVVLASEEIIDLVQRVLPPYPLPTPSIQAAMRAFSDGALAIARKRITELRERRDELAASLRKLACVRRAYPSDANFLLVEFSDAERVATVLRTSGILARGFDSPRLKHCLRISIGTAGEMRDLRSALKKPENADA